MSTYNCRVCGLRADEEPWGIDGNTPKFEICRCCGVEFGNEDYTVDSAKQYRKKWIDGGAAWFALKEKPVDWDMQKQLEDIPEEYK